MRDLRPSYLLTLLLLSGLTAEGCTTSSSDRTGASVADHTVGEPVTLNDRHVWIEASDDDWAKGISPPSAESGTPVSRTDVTTLRLQQWLDRFHVIVGDILMQRGEQLLAPKPSAALFKELGPNAWVSAGFACPSGWNVKTTGSLGGGDAYLMLNGQYAIGTDFAERCVQPQNWGDDKAAFVRFWNHQLLPCRLDVNDSGDLTVSGSTCSVYGSSAPMLTYGVASTIGVTLDALSWGEEMRVAATLAHELGHYYRAHTNPIVQKHLDFFFRVEQDGPDVPVEAEESARYESIVQELRMAPRPVRLKTKTRYNKRLAGSLFTLRSFCPSARITDAAARSIMNGQVTSSSTGQYVAFENAFASCASKLSLDDPGRRDQLSEILRSTRVYKSFSPSAATVDDALADLTAQLDETDRGEASLVAQMATGKFGWYTDKQEADEIGLELATRAGLKPSEVIEAQLRTYEQLDEAYARAGIDRADEVTAAQCKEWLAAGFTKKGADGKKTPIIVPIGSLSDPHHEGCYRVYNLWRESKRHAYEVAPALPELSPPWKEIQAKAIALGASAPPSVDGSGPDDGSTPPPDDTDPEESAPPPRKRSPAATEPDPAAPGTTTVTRTTGGCSSAPSSPASTTLVFGAVLFALGLVRRRRDRRSSTSA